MNAKILLLVLGLGILSIPDSRAQILVSNVTSPNQFNLFLFSSGAPGGGDFAGMPFVTDNFSYSLTSATAVIKKVTGSVPMSSALYLANAGGLPTGAPLTTFTNGTIPSSYSNIVFTPTSALTLNPNTEYVFVLQPSGGYGSNWAWGLSNSPIVTGSGSMPYYYDTTSTGGQSWATSPIVVLGAVNATRVVPEPSALLLLPGGLLLLMLFRFRRREIFTRS